MPKAPKLLFLLIPGVVFLLVLTAFLVRIPKTPTSTKTENSLFPLSVATPTPISVSKTPLQNFIQSVNDLDINDPQLTPPNFDRKVSLPAEK